MNTKILIVAVLTLSMISCKTNEENGQNDKKVEVTSSELATPSQEKTDFDQKITEKYWKLVELNGKKIAFGENQRKEAHFILKNAENKVTGNGGCNTLMGTYELGEDNKIIFSKMATTIMFCAGVENEDEFLAVFETVDHYTLQGDTLLFQKENKVLAKFAAVYFQ